MVESGSIYRWYVVEDRRPPPLDLIVEPLATWSSRYQGNIRTAAGSGIKPVLMYSSLCEHTHSYSTVHEPPHRQRSFWCFMYLRVAPSVSLLVLLFSKLFPLSLSLSLQIVPPDHEHIWPISSIQLGGENLYLPPSQKSKSSDSSLDHLLQ